MEPAHGINAAHTAPAAAAQKKPDPALKKACADFESLFIYMMLQEMEKSVPREEGYPGNSSESGIYRDMLNQELAAKMSGPNGMGLAKILEQQLQQNNSK